jgi:hypothetical protein
MQSENLKAGQELTPPDGVQDGDVLVYMRGRLLVVDHLVPEAYTLDLVALEAAEAAMGGDQ